MKYFLTILSALLFYASGLAQSAFSKRADVLVKGESFERVLDRLSETFQVEFSYVQSVLPAAFVQRTDYTAAKLIDILNDICNRNQLVWLTHNDRIILRQAKQSERFYYLKGIVREEKEGRTVPYASIYMKSKKYGTAADREGEFELRVSSNDLRDTVVISFLGYKRQFWTVSELLKTSMAEIILKENTFVISTVDIKAKKFKSKELGNNSKIAAGAMYLDTHGQQVALFIENAKHTAGGYIASVSLYLSKQGNTSAPFRLRLMHTDSLRQKPADDMFDEVLIVQPANGHKGWYTVNLRQYRLRAPAEGFFIAMQGIYPNDYEVTITDDFDKDDGTDQPDEAEISYGQRLGYTKSRKHKSNTWHYSLSHTWFQLKNQKYAVMMSAEIKYETSTRNNFHTRK